MACQRTVSVRTIVALWVFTQGRHLGYFILGELNLLEVLDNARRSNRLGNDAVPANLGPSKAKVEYIS